jgi:hypothetical protein
MLLATDLWVAALIRRVEQGGAFATVVRKGDARAGTVLVKAVDLRNRTARLFAEAFGATGDRIWMEPVASTEEAALDAYVERAARIDPDLWLVEIEDAEGWRFLTEPVEIR